MGVVTHSVAFSIRRLCQHRVPTDSFLNGLERINREIRRRTRVVSIFPHPASYLRLVSAILIEVVPSASISMSMA